MPAFKKAKDKVEVRHRIAPALAGLAVPIESLIPDTNNARTHGEENMEAIRKSLERYGQLKPIVVREETGVIVAGNGTYLAAKSLGWTEIAANVVPMTEIEATGYGLADNRTAELAEWDFEVVGRLERLMAEAGEGMVGWTEKDIQYLRASEEDWIPPEPGANGNGAGGKGVTLRLPPGSEVAKLFGRATDLIRVDDPAKDDLACLEVLLRVWLED